VFLDGLFSLLRLPLDVITCAAMLAALASA